MATQLVRIEHEDGLGIFRAQTIDGKERGHYVANHNYSIILRHHNFNTPREDKLDFTDEHFCGYKSIDQLQQWIMKDEFELLFKLGYSIFLIEVSDCQIGRDQIIFRKEDIIRKTNINQLFL